MEELKLKSILKLKFIQEMPRENKMAYLVSVGMGTGAGILIYFLLSIGGIEILNSLLIKITISSLIPFLIFILLFILLKKIPTVYMVARTKIACAIFLLFGYMWGFGLPIGLSMCFTLELFDFFLCFLEMFFYPIIILFFGIIWLFEYPSQSPLLFVFLFSNVITILIACIITKDIKNLLKRIIVIFILTFLIYLVSASPLIYIHLAG